MKFTKFIPVCMVLLISATALAQTYSVSGRVTDQTSGNGVQGVTVAVATGTSLTDATGSYTVANVPVGTQVLTANSPNFSIDSVALNVTEAMMGQDLLAYPGKVLAVPVLKARKDTRLLCLDGCDRTGAHAWNASRESADHLGKHDVGYCVYTQIAMVNRFFGGNFTRDEAASITHKYATPEKELGHG